MCAAEVDRHVAQRYLLRRRLGKGAYGIVWKAVDRRTGEVVAIKKIFDAFRDKTDAQRTFREITFLRELGGHPNIIRLLEVIRAENDRDIYLVFESMDTDLSVVISKGKLLKDIHKRYIFCQLLRATQFIHSGNVVHRDQKPSNVLLDANCLVKLCDFGLARSLSQLPEGPEGQALTEYVATRWYRAPEVLLSSRWYTPAVDMWSLGCILGEMLRGRPLFPDFAALDSSCRASLLHRLRAHPRQMLDALLPPDSPPEALDLLKRLLVFVPDKRLSAAEALRHPYVQRFHCPAREWTLGAAVCLPGPQGAQLSAHEYRRCVYQMILEQRSDRRVQRQAGLGGTSPEGRPRTSGGKAQRPQEPLWEPGALGAVQHPSGTAVPNSGALPESSHADAPTLENSGGAKNIPRQNQALRPQPVPPTPGGLGKGAGPLGATAAESSSWVKRHLRPAVPSLTSQAAAKVANQALIRRQRTSGPGLRAAGAREVSPARPALSTPQLSPPPAVPSSPLPCRF